MKKLSIILLLSLFVVSCGGGDGDGDGSGTPPDIGPAGPSPVKPAPPVNDPDLLDDEGFPSLVPLRWSFIGTAVDENNNVVNKWYIDYNSVTVDATTDYLISWQLVTHTETSARKDGIYPVVWTEVVVISDCENNRSTIKREISKDLTKRVFSDRTFNPSPWIQINADTIGEVLLDTVCDG